MVNSHSKHIRWSALLGVLIMLIVSTVGCAGSGKYEFKYNTKSIVKVETLYLDDAISDQDYIKAVEQLENNNFSSFDVVSQIQGDRINDFVNDFSGLKCRFDNYEPLIGITGKSFLINYEDGSWELINRYCSSLYDAQRDELGIGSGSWYFEEDEFDALWEQYSSLQ